MRESEAAALPQLRETAKYREETTKYREEISKYREKITEQVKRKQILQRSHV